MTLPWSFLVVGVISLIESRLISGWVVSPFLSRQRTHNRASLSSWSLLQLTNGPHLTDHNSHNGKISVQQQDETDQEMELEDYDEDTLCFFPSDTTTSNSNTTSTTATATTATDAPLVSAETIQTLLLDHSKTNISYFYLKNELGMSEEAMWRITYEAPSALGMTAATIRRKVNVLIDTMNLTMPETRSVLEQAPAVLHLSADKNLAPTIVHLLRLLDLSRQELKTLILACPSVLGYSKDNLKAKIHFFTHVMGYTKCETRSLLLDEPKLLRSSVRQGLIPHLHFFVRDLNISRKHLRTMVQKNPKLLLYNLDQNLVPKLVFFAVMLLHMEPDHLLKLLLAYPQFVDYNLERSLKPLAQYFLHHLEFSPTEFRSILLAYPRILNIALRKIKHRVGFLRYERGFTAPQVKRILYQAPQVLALTDENLQGKIHFVEQTFQPCLTDEEIRSILVGMPKLLVLNVENNLQPKVNFLLHEAFGGDSRALCRAMVRLPTLLGYSLTRRIQPRVEALARNDPVALDPARITVGIPMTQVKFDTWLANQKRKQSQQLTHKEENQNDKDDPSSPSRTSQTEEPFALPSGRIVHWTRERNPRGSVGARLV